MDITVLASPARLQAATAAGAAFSAWCRQGLRSLLARSAREALDDRLAAAAHDVAAVRALADRHRESDPGFASDLYAAADRCEAQDEAAREAALGASAVPGSR